MAFTEKISLVVDVVTGQSRSSLRTLKTDLDNADGAFAKMKVGASGAMDFLKQNAGTAALAAGSAIAAFGVKAVGDFQDVALGAGQLRDSLGVTADEASRLQEVASDLGIGVGALESTIGKMNKTAASTPEAFEAIGASIKKNKDGTTDVTETFLSAIDALNRIPDATKRAEAAQKIFGRSWQDISELVATGANGVREAMAGVESAKLINDEEIVQARKFRDTLDELRGVGESLTLSVGANLVPQLTELGEAALTVKDAIEFLTDKLPPWAQALLSGAGDVNHLTAGMTTFHDGIADTAAQLRQFDTQLHDTSLRAREQAEVVDQEVVPGLYRMSIVARDARDADKSLANAMVDVENAADRQARAHQKLREEVLRGTGTTFDFESAELELADAVDGVATAAAEAETVLADSATTDAEKAAAVRDVRSAEIDAAAQALTTAQAYAHEQGAAEGSAESARLQRDALSMLQHQFPGLRDEIQRYIDQLNMIPATKTTTVNVRSATGSVRRGTAFAEQGGTNYGPAGTILVGEKGPELVELPAGHRTHTADETARILANSHGSGSPIGVATAAPVINVYVTAPLGDNPAALGQKVVRAVVDGLKLSGPAELRKALNLSPVA